MKALTTSIHTQPLLQPLQNWQSVSGGGVRFHHEGDARPADVQQQLNADGSQQQQDPNQQQQQQQTVQYVDPFSGIDIDLLDQPVRDAVIAARTTGQNLAREAAAARTWQSKHDQAQATLQQLQNRQQDPNAQNQQQQQQNQNQPPTLEQELYLEYREAGMKDEEAKANAKFQAKILGKFASRVTGFVDSRIAPLNESVAMQQAEAGFVQASQNPATMKYFPPEVAQKVWEKVANNTAQGVDMTPASIVSLAKIYYVDHLEATQQSGAQQIPLVTHMQQPNPPQQQSRLSYPGAGSVISREPVQRRTILDPDTAAASEATKVAMRSWMPKAPVVTRGGNR